MQIYYEDQNIAEKLINRTLAKLHKLKLNITSEERKVKNIFLTFT